VNAVLRVSRELADDVRAIATQTVQLAFPPSPRQPPAKAPRSRRAVRREKASTGPSPAAAGKLQLSDDTTRLIHQLSPKERHVVGLLLDSARSSQIAQDMKISVHTVRQHLKHIFRKAGVHSQQELLERLRGRRHR
jgi:DNA-binding CsgD family transcriptional regulator